MAKHRLFDARRRSGAYCYIGQHGALKGELVQCLAAKLWLFGDGAPSKLPTIIQAPPLPLVEVPIIPNQWQWAGDSVIAGVVHEREQWNRNG